MHQNIYVINVQHHNAALKQQKTFSQWINIYKLIAQEVRSNWFCYKNKGYYCNNGIYKMNFFNIWKDQNSDKFK